MSKKRPVNTTTDRQTSQQAERDINKRVPEVMARHRKIQRGQNSAEHILKKLTYAAHMGCIASFAVGLALFPIFTTLCQYYSTLSAGYTLFTGIKLAFSGQSFPIEIALPFKLYHTSFSSILLGWGLLSASQHGQQRSFFGTLLGAAILVIGVGATFNLFYFQQSTIINAPGYWGSIISGLATVWLGCFTLQISLKPRRKIKT